MKHNRSTRLSKDPSMLLRMRVLVVFVLCSQNWTRKYVMCYDQRNEQRKLDSRRRLIYIPPPPITPFRGNIKTVHKNESQASTNSSISAWTPEQYPDPWTNPLACGGAATAQFKNGMDRTAEYSTNSTTGGESVLDRDFMNWFDIPPRVNDGQQNQIQQKRKLLFCDPDQLLDKDTLRSVAMKLQAFAEAFASDSMSLAEGGNFGSESEDTALGSREDGNAISIEGNVTEYILFNFVNSIKNKFQKGNTDALSSSEGVNRKRKLRGFKHLSLGQDISRDLGVWEEGSIKEPIEVAVALVKKIDLPAILRADSYFFYSDQDDMMNDAAQYFARYIHDTWYRHLMMQEQSISSPTNIVLIFISTSDKICYISSGTRIAAILPWWRLEHVVQSMKPDLRKGQTGKALGIAVDDLTQLLRQGPPSFLDRLDDFVERFGVVIAFTVFTFVFATWGECRDRRKRFFSAERMSRMNSAEREKARQLQRSFQTKSCPICLEPFKSKNKVIEDDKSSSTQQKQRNKLVDDLGIPLIGNDGQPIKMLRCGHIFDSTCWKTWADSGQGNPWVCPVCRQDIGRAKRRRANSSSHDQASNGAAATRRDDSTNQNEVGERRTAYVRVPHVTPSMLLLPVGHTHPSYSSFVGTSFTSFSHPPLRQLYPRHASSSNIHADDNTTEETPLFRQVVGEESDDY